MRVGLDARKVADFGIGTYIRNLAPRLVEAAPSSWEWVFFHQPGDEALLPQGRGVTLVEEKAGNYSLRELWSLSAAARRFGLDLYHAPHYVLPLRLPCPSVVTVHDLIHLLFPDYLPHPPARRYARFMIGRAVQGASRVITVSLSSERDIRRLFPKPLRPVTVIPNGVEEVFTPRPLPEVREWLAHSLDVKGSYLLFVGNPKRHKNLDLLLRAYGRLQGSHPGLQLIVVGAAESAHAGLAARAGTLGASGARFFSAVDHDTLAFLYTAATVFVFPSLYEGFGLPPLEAMACGAPVAASNRSSIPEVLGPAASYFSPDSVDSLMTVLCRLLDDSDLRARLSRIGRSRAAAFSWEHAARKTLDVYESAAGGGE